MRQALTLTELLVALGILAVLAGVLLPALFLAREKGRQAICLSHLRQILLAVSQYAQDWDERLPMNAYQGADGWGRPCLVTLTHALRPFGVSPLTLCPTEPQAFRLGPFLSAKGLGGQTCDLPEEGGSYAINVAVFVRGDAPALGWQRTLPLRLSQLRAPTVAVGVYDGNVAGEQRCGFQTFDAAVQGRHLNAANIGFLDGHAKAYPTLASGCQAHNINGTFMAENCVSGESPYRRRCGEKSEVPCVHHFLGLPDRDARGECINPP